MRDKILTYGTDGRYTWEMPSNESALLAATASSLFIDGRWDRADAVLPVVDPATQESFHEVGLAGAGDVERAIAAARRAQPAWAATSASDRGAILRRWSDLIFQHVEELAAIEAQDVGKPLRHAFDNIYFGGSLFAYFGGYADKHFGVTLPTRADDRRGFTQREPLGVCALIIAWNVPTVLAAAELAPALAAGNAVVLKPSEHAPLAPMALAELGRQAGLPDGVLNVVPGYGPDAGAALTSSRQIDHISFVGSTTTGRAIAHAAADLLVPVKLELGGKSPNIVFADADLDAAVPAIVTAITENAGQNCNAGSRLLVEASVYDEVIDRVAEQMRAVRVGAWHENLDMGPLINAGQYERVTGYQRIAADEGAKAVIGGADADAPRPGWFVAPTLFDGVTPDMRIAREEVFGPVLVAQRFDGLDDAVAKAGDTDFGLLVSVWTNDLSRAFGVADRVKSGQVSVNEHGNTSVVGFPFNVTGESGYNHGGGYNAMNEYTREKAVTIRLLTPR